MSEKYMNYLKAFNPGEYDRVFAEREKRQLDVVFGLQSLQESIERQRYKEYLETQKKLFPYMVGDVRC